MVRPAGVQSPPYHINAKHEKSKIAEWIVIPEVIGDAAGLVVHPKYRPACQAETYKSDRPDLRTPVDHAGQKRIQQIEHNYHPYEPPDGCDIADGEIRVRPYGKYRVYVVPPRISHDNR